MPEKDKIKVLLVDDHPFVREGIRACLLTQHEFEIVGEAETGKAAIDKSQTLQPSVVVMDITMPMMNGIEATRQLRKFCPEIKILILTVHDKREFTSQIIEAGARGYVSKNASPTELMRAIRAVHRGETFFPSPMTEDFLKNYLDTGGKPKLLKSSELSLRERQVLTLIAEGFLNKEAASILGVSVRTIEKHRERIMEKLQLHSVVDLTKYAIAHQMVQVDSTNA